MSFSLWHLGTLLLVALIYWELSRFKTRNVLSRPYGGKDNISPRTSSHLYPPTRSQSSACQTTNANELESHMLQQTGKLLLGYTSEGLSLTLVLVHPQEVLVGQSPRQQHSQNFIYVSKPRDARNSAGSFDLMSLEFSLPCKGKLPVNGWSVGIRLGCGERRGELASELGAAKGSSVGICGPACEWTSVGPEGAQELVGGVLDAGEVVIKQGGNATCRGVIEEIVGCYASQCQCTSFTASERETTH